MTSGRLPLGNWNWSFFSDAAWPLRVQTFAVYAAVIAGLIGLVWLTGLGDQILAASFSDLLWGFAGIAFIIWVVLLVRRPGVWRAALETAPSGRPPPLFWRVAIDAFHLLYAALFFALGWWLIALKFVGFPQPWWMNPFLIALGLGMPAALKRMQGFFLRRFGWVVAMGF